jgi:hypothetical protein
VHSVLSHSRFVYNIPFNSLFKCICSVSQICVAVLRSAYCSVHFAVSDIIVHVLPHKISDSASSVGCLECNFMDFRKNYQCKMHGPVLVSEQTLSHALAGNSSTYTVLWKWHWYLQNSSFYKTIKIMQHAISTYDAVRRGAMWYWLLYCIKDWDSPTVF